jgi:hypothetical protein
MDLIKKDEMGVMCSIHTRVRIHIKFWSEILKGRDHSEELGIDGMIIL